MIQSSPTSAASATVKAAPPSPSPIKSILVDAAARESQFGDGDDSSPGAKPVQSVVIDADATAFECSTTASSAGMTTTTDSASPSYVYSVSTSNTGQKQNLNEYNGDEIVDYLQSYAQDHRGGERRHPSLRANTNTNPTTHCSCYGQR
jgi:hypothetical protein